MKCVRETGDGIDDELVNDWRSIRLRAEEEQDLRFWFKRIFEE